MPHPSSNEISITIGDVKDEDIVQVPDCMRLMPRARARAYERRLLQLIGHLDCRLPYESVSIDPISQLCG